MDNYDKKGCWNFRVGQAWRLWSNTFYAVWKMLLSENLSWLSCVSLWFHSLSNYGFMVFVTVNGNVVFNCMADLQEQWQDVHPPGHMFGPTPDAHWRERPLPPAWEICRQAASLAEMVIYCSLLSSFLFLGVRACCIEGKVQCFFLRSLEEKSSFFKVIWRKVQCC